MAESNKFVYDTSAETGAPLTTHQWYDGTPHPWEFKRVWHLEPSPVEAETVYAGVEDAALFKSTDGGKNWKEVSGLRGHGTGAQWSPGAGGLGLHTILLDPNNANQMLAGSEQILFELPSIGSAIWHMGGSIQFGPDGKIYIAVGDHQQSSNSQSLTSPFGISLRCRPSPSTMYFTANDSFVSRFVAVSVYVSDRAPATLPTTSASVTDGERNSTTTANPTASSRPAAILDSDFMVVILENRVCERCECSAPRRAVNVSATSASGGPSGTR
jgi:hypothetical protein